MISVPKDIDAGTSVRDAAIKLSDLKIGSLLVKKNNAFVGLITEEEITRQLVAKNLDSGNTCVGDIMKSDMDYIDQSQTMSQAISAMREKKLRYLVVRDGKSIVGILSVKDLMSFYEKWFELTL